MGSMAKKDTDLLDRLHASGLRKTVAKTIADATGRAQKDGGKIPKNVKSMLDDLGGLAREVEDRVKGGPAKRSAAAKKGARTKARAASARSTAARKGAATRAKASPVKKATTRAKASTTRARKKVS